MLTLTTHPKRIICFFLLLETIAMIIRTVLGQQAMEMKAHTIPGAMLILDT
jgi:hypothetical protein